jgi:hypothetical protein
VERHEGEAYVKFARRLPLQADDVALLERASKVGDAAAAGILAQTQPTEKVLDLVLSPNRRVRSAATTWAPANPEISEEALERRVTPFPSGEIRQLRGDLGKRRMMLALLDAAPPETRAWRAKLLASTWRPQLTSGLLQLLEDDRPKAVMKNFWAVRGSSP